MEFCSRCCFCVHHEKHTDRLSVRQQSIYCVKNARNTLSVFIYLFFKEKKKVYMRGISTRCGGVQETFVFFFSLSLYASNTVGGLSCAETKNQPSQLLGCGSRSKHLRKISLLHIVLKHMNCRSTKGFILHTPLTSEVELKGQILKLCSIF